MRFPVVAAFARAVRTLRRSPGFVAVAVLSLGVGLGLTTATFAMVDSILYPKLGFADADRLFFAQLRLGNQRTGPSLGEQVRALAALPAIEQVAAVAQEFASVEVNGASVRHAVYRVTPDLYSLLGTRLALGRLPTDEEARTQTAVVVSQFGWHDLFASRPEIGDATMTIGDQVYSVVGVLPVGVERTFEGVGFVPFAAEGELDRLRAGRILVKLRLGADTVALKSQLAVLAAGFTAAYVKPPTPPFRLTLHGLARPPLRLSEHEFELLLIGIAFGILAIACTNVAALTLARGLTRRRDYALRIALGASRLAIAGDVLAEVAVIAVLGTVLGLMLTMSLVGVITHMVPAEITWMGLLMPALNLRVFGLSAAALVAGIAIAGGMPAWRASRVDPADPLKDNAGTTTGRSRAEFRLLVMGELAISMVLLMLASLMTVSMKNIVNYEFGYDARRLLATDVTLGAKKDTMTQATRLRLQAAALDRIRATPGVASAATVTREQPDERQVTSDARGEARPLPLTYYSEVGPGFFATMGIPIVEGREFSVGDRTGGAVILSQTAVKKLFPHGGALGRMVKLGGERSRLPWLPVVGVSRDVDFGIRSGSDVEPEPGVFASTPDERVQSWRIAIRPARDDATLPVTLQRTLRDLLPRGAASPVGPWLDQFGITVKYLRFLQSLFSFVGAAALLLGATGLFSVLSYAVGQRMREFAVRVALGSTPRGVLKLVMRSAFELALGGTAVGALLSFAASAGMSAMLFGVKNTDPVSLVVAEGTLLLVTLLASLPPAIRAMRADPVEILRST